MRIELVFASMMLVMSACEDEGGSEGDTSSMDTGGMDSGSSDTGEPGNLCDPVDPSPDAIGETQMDTEYPTPAGGEIAEGTYYLSRFEVYAPATADDHVRRRRIDVSGNTLVSTNVDDEEPVDLRGGTFTVNGAELQLMLTCPDMIEAAVPFTAMDGELWLFDPTEPNVQVYTLQ